MKFRYKRMKRAEGCAYLKDDMGGDDVLTVYDADDGWKFDMTGVRDEDAFRKNPRCEEWAIPFNYRAAVLIPLDYYE